MNESGVPQDCTRCGLCREVCLAEKLGQHTITSLLSGGDCYSAWRCSCCQLCQEICPEGVDVHRVMVSARRREPAPEPYRRGFEHVLRCGYALPIDEEINVLRAAYGLAPVKLVPAGRVQKLLESS
jgi:heterodisulfide reductase subunit C